MELTINTPMIGLVLTVLGNLMLFAWAAGKVRSELTHLGNSVKRETQHLSTAIDKLSSVLDRTGERVDNHESRIAVLEDRGDTDRRSGKDRRSE